MVYNGSCTGDTCIGEIMSGMNDMTSGVFGIVFLILVWAVTYWVNAGEPTREAMAASSFITFIAALLGRYIGIVQDTHLAVTAFMLIGSLVMLWNRE